MIKFVSDLQQVSGFLRVLLFPPPIKLTSNNWNIVESGIKHHNPNPKPVVNKNFVLNNNDSLTLFLFILKPLDKRLFKWLTDKHDYWIWVE